MDDGQLTAASGKAFPGLPGDQPDGTALGAEPVRKMRCAVLMGAHLHHTTCGINVHIWERDGKFLARGRYQGKPFGRTLGADERQAQAELRRLLTAIEDGTFLRPSEARRRPLKVATVPAMNLRQLCSEFLTEKRKTCGANTSQDYQCRLAPILDFAERQESKRRWPLARDIDRHFVVELRVFLVNRQVPRNGRPGAPARPMSTRQVFNCLETLRAMLAWGARADVRRLPPEYVNPCSRDLVGTCPSKNPLRPVALTLPRRVALIQTMDLWQILHLSILLVLPLRFEDLARALVSDVSLSERTLRLGTRFGGGDFNKGRVDVVMPLPEQMLPVLRRAIGDRPEGPLLRSRGIWEERRRSGSQPQSRQELERLFEEMLASAPAGSVQAEQDRKQVFRRLMRELGAITEDEIGKEFKKLFARIDLGPEVRPYDLRGAVSTDMKSAGIAHLELRYLTEHSTNDIMNVYVPVDPLREMQKYFEHCQPLLDAIRDRAGQSGMGSAAMT